MLLFRRVFAAECPKWAFSTLYIVRITCRFAVSLCFPIGIHKPFYYTKTEMKLVLFVHGNFTSFSQSTTTTSRQTESAEAVHIRIYNTKSVLTPLKTKCYLRKEQVDYYCPAIWKPLIWNLGNLHVFVKAPPKK